MFGTNTRSGRILKLCQTVGDKKDIAKNFDKGQIKNRKRKPFSLLNTRGSSTLNYLELYDEGNWEILDRLLTQIPKKIKLDKDDNSTSHKENVSTEESLSTTSQSASQNLINIRPDLSACHSEYVLTTSQDASQNLKNVNQDLSPCHSQNALTTSQDASQNLKNVSQDLSPCHSQNVSTTSQDASQNLKNVSQDLSPCHSQNVSTTSQDASQNLKNVNQDLSPCHSQNALTTSQDASQNLKNVSQDLSPCHSQNVLTTSQDGSQNLKNISQDLSVCHSQNVLTTSQDGSQNLKNISQDLSVYHSQNVLTTSQDGSQNLKNISQDLSVCHSQNELTTSQDGSQNLKNISQDLSVCHSQNVLTTSQDGSQNLKNISQDLSVYHSQNVLITSQNSHQNLKNINQNLSACDSQNVSTTSQYEWLNGLFFVEIPGDMKGKNLSDNLELAGPSVSITCDPDLVYSSPDDDSNNLQNSTFLNKSRRCLFNDADYNHQQVTTLDYETKSPKELFSSENIDNKKQNIITTASGKKLRRYDRRNFCLFCNNLVLNFRRHVINNHKNETIIAEYLALFEQFPHESKKRRQLILSELVLRGNNLYNQSLMQYEPSEIDPNQLLPVRRPPIDKKVNVTDYVTCTLCQGLFRRKHFYQHGAECKNNNNEASCDEAAETHMEDEVNLDDQIIKRRKNVFLKHYAVQLHPGTLNVSEKMKSIIIPIIRKDQVGTKAISDSLLLDVTSDFYSSHQAYKDRTQVTRKLRDGAKLLEMCQSLDNSIKELRDIFHPSKINTVIEACQSLCNLKDNTSKHVVVGMNGRLSWILEECSKKLIEEIVCSELLTDDQKKEKRRNVKHFQECIRRRWKYCISTNIENARRRYKIMKDTIMPQDEDIHKFVAMLKKMEIKYQQKVRDQLNVFNYEMLCKVTICHIITLNRRRPFEAAQSELTFYQNRERDCKFYSKELLRTFAEEERIILEELTSYVVPAKGSENVATILLTKQMETSIDLIIECRPHFNLNNNIYLFARPGLTTPFDGSKVMNELKSFCSGLKTSKHLTATGLRKHVATMGHMKGVEFTSKLSQFMCHTQAVHDKNYVAPLQMVHRGIIGSYLVGLEGTNIENANSQPNEENTLYNQSNTNDLKEQIQDPDFNPDDEQDVPSFIKRKKRWTEIEKITVIEYFSDLIKKKINPGIVKSRIFLEKYVNIVGERTPAQINTFIDNINKGKLKLPIQYQYLNE